MPTSKTHAFKIISASAGSGKTYTLVFHYLKELLGKTKPYPFREMLALTFTNKAVQEMKSRILTTLAALAQDPKDQPMAAALCEDLGFSETVLQERSQIRLRQLLQDYGAFDVLTIDKFNHRLVRTFATDLKLPYSFEVVVDSDEILDALIDTLLDKVGEDDTITQLLVTFSLQKLKDQKSWDVGVDLKDVAPLLMNESDRIPLKHLKNLTHQDFKTIKDRLVQNIDQIASDLRTVGKQTVDLMSSKGLDASDFNRGMVFNHFQQFIDFDEKNADKIESTYNNKLQENLENGTNIYKKATPELHKKYIDQLLPVLLEAFNAQKSHVFRLIQSQKLLGQLTPLSLLGQMEKTLETLQHENQQMLLGRFNELIAAVIAKQPAPFIYERLGEKYLNYYIDEFQDTSQLQWKNLLPLISNTLEGVRQGGDPGSLFLVGDAKQAIYRWRGGHVDQFLGLLAAQTPFQIKPNVEKLPSNYRSASQIVDFNNRLFTYLGKYLSVAEHQALYGQATQQPIDQKEGCVTITLIPEGKKKAERSAPYISTLVTQLLACKAQQYKWSDMVVLVRQKDTATQVAKGLSAQNIPVISSEALLLSQAPRVLGLMGLIQLVLDANNPEFRRQFFELLWEEKGADQPFYDFMKTYLEGSLYGALQNFNTTYETTFDFDVFQSLSLYEGVEYALSTLKLPFENDVYIQFFLDVLHEFSCNHLASWHHFERHWERHHQRWSLQLSESIDAVQIMTIHKAKGLEFPVVFLPFLEAEFQPNKDRIWAPIHTAPPLEWGWFKSSKKLEKYPTSVAEAYHKNSAAAQLDAANVLYVACTRAVDQLHIISRHDTDDPNNNYATLLHGFLKEEGLASDHGTSFEWGSQAPRIGESKDQSIAPQKFKMQLGLGWQKRLINQMDRPDADQQAVTPRAYGILIHQLFAAIKYQHQVDEVFERAIQFGWVLPEQGKKLKPLFKTVVGHPKLHHAFEEGIDIWIEQELMMPNGETLRPDRFVRTPQGITLIDFKSGKPHSTHQNQLQQYAEALSFLETPIAHQFLVYLDKKVVVMEL
ncbi:MAG: UvrD-helicase domain-containing protein [Bacteroidetes bacterium]|nr:UvrD-helicase domain-containing protein [Bacteroidota bacterium]MDA0938246.1 UvrD-helicase domain-containing protein [Bacteroidota bacterium]MDA1344639.1 UvrD-helicase domain-containing protein [Bacteroidota bacterium]